MPKIKYEFCDGTISEYDADDALYSVHEQLLQEEKRNHWKNTRRHISLSYLNEHEIDIEASGGELLDALITQEDEKEFDKLLSAALRPKQVEILKMVLDGTSVTEIAKQEGVLHSAISHRLKTILKKLKIFSEKPHNLLSPVLIGGGMKTAYYILRGLRK